MAGRPPTKGGVNGSNPVSPTTKPAGQTLLFVRKAGLRAIYVRCVVPSTCDAELAGLCRLKRQERPA
jgi:hypothetical protein